MDAATTGASIGIWTAFRAAVTKNNKTQPDFYCPLGPSGIMVPRDQRREDKRQVSKREEMR